jgi:ribonuclease D
LQALKTAMTKLSGEYSLPTENILTPDYMRQLAWNLEIKYEDEVRDFLRNCGARGWQLDLVSAEFSACLTDQPIAGSQNSQAVEHEEL